MAAPPCAVSSSSFPLDPFRWNVFLSFRGEDTRNNFTPKLYAALQREGIETFKDDEKLRRGELISDALEKAIKESRFAIIIFSRNYANSRWCLDELRLIMECLKSHEVLKVFPVFLSGVDPLDIKHQRGSFGEPFGGYEERFGREIVERWRSALMAAAQFSGSGWRLADFGFRFMDKNSVTPTSSVIFGWDYDVTLNYAEEDEETIGMNNFIGKLYASLEEANFKTFKGDPKNPERGEQMMISDGLKKGIKGSRCAVIIFSRNFASSTRCLEEVAFMMECRNKFGQTVFPVFLMGVEGSDVRRQQGSLEEPFRKHEQCFDQKVVVRWSSALKIAGELSGLNLKDIPDRDEEKLIAKIVKDVSAVLSEIPPPNAATEMYTEPITETQPSTQHKLRELLGYIGDPQIDIIGLYGMGGVGKTTLAKEVNNHFQNNLDRRIKIPFDIVIMVTVSATPDVQSIRASFVKRLGLPETTQVDALSKALSKKRFLLILDDVWCKLNLEDIGIPRPTRKNKGSKIVVISRSQDTCIDMDTRKTIKAQPLSQVESWDLFVDKAGEHVTADNIKHLAKKIVGRCKGLPLAIVTVARAMANRHTIGSWENALREMELSSSELRGMKEEVFVPLKFSFDRLEDDMLRSLFLYFACFPEDYNIGGNDFDEMLNFCVGEGLADKLGSLKAARGKGEHLIESLKIACMLEDGEMEGAVKMHDMMRDLALWITSSSYCDSSYPKHLTRANRSVEEAPLANEWLDVTRVSLVWCRINNLIELGETCQKLTTLLLGRSEVCTIPQTNFFQHMNHLCILDLSYTNVRYLPNSVSYLENLRVLRLQWCFDLTELPPLGMLQQLQVLDVRGCYYLSQQILGPNDMGYERNLRYLNVVETGVSIPQGIFCRLRKLEEASFQGARNIQWRFVDVKDHDKGNGHACCEKRNREKELKEAEEIRSNPDVRELFHLKYLRYLTIEFEDVTISDWFKPLVDKLRVLSLNRCSVEEQALQAINQSQNLQEILLDGCSSMTCVCMGASVTILRRCNNLKTVMEGAKVYEGERYLGPGLILDSLPRLERIIVSITPSSCFGRLKCINISCCNSLKMVFTKEMPCLLNNLERFLIESCYKMEVIIEAVAEEEEKIGEFVGGVISRFPMLELLELYNLPALHDLCSHNQTLHCPRLRDMTVEACPMLKKDPLNIQVADVLVEMMGNTWRNERV